MGCDKKANAVDRSRYTINGVCFTVYIDLYTPIINRRDVGQLAYFVE